MELSNKNHYFNVTFNSYKKVIFNSFFYNK